MPLGHASPTVVLQLPVEPLLLELEELDDDELLELELLPDELLVLEEPPPSSPKGTEVLPPHAPAASAPATVTASPHVFVERPIAGILARPAVTGRGPSDLRGQGRAASPW